MIANSNQGPIYRLRTAPKDIGVVLILATALVLGWLLYQQTTSRTIAFTDAVSGVSLSYPATWIGVDSLQDVALKVQDPTADSAFKTSFVLETRPLDPASPPTLQTLLDRRVEERGQLTAYHFITEREATVDGARAIVSDYAYVVQPIDEPRRVALPVVVQAREYIVVATDSSYYFTLAAPEHEFADANRRFEELLRSVRLPGTVTSKSSPLACHQVDSRSVARSTVVSTHISTQLASQTCSACRVVPEWRCAKAVASASAAARGPSIVTVSCCIACSRRAAASSTASPTGTRSRWPASIGWCGAPVCCVSLPPGRATRMASVISGQLELAVDYVHTNLVTEI
ncbi:hypothetical protein HC891_01785 [Candidatus Gracilibacteria bacterium]|nr:hypothetical protein [Candidatus Gracilibacteria bacterium]